MSLVSLAADSVATLVGLDGRPLRAIGPDLGWSLELREDSTNELVLEGVALADAADVVQDMEVLFQGRRFKIQDVDRDRAVRSAAITAEEAQVEFSEGTVPSFKLDGARLSKALERAVAGTPWSSGGVYDDTGTYYADFENQTAAHLLQFLQAQSGQVLHYDSINRVVSLERLDDAPLDRVFTYSGGATTIIRKGGPVEATVIEPTGRGGETIAHGERGLEDL